MVALIKQESLTPRENQTSTRKAGLQMARPAPRSRRARPPSGADTEVIGLFPKPNEESKPEELVREKATGGVESAAGATAAAGAEAEEPVLEPRGRERSSYDADSTFKLYLREIGQVKLLTPPEERQLAVRIKRGDKKAREHMIKANLRLVVKIARDYEGIGLPLMDLISEGNLGLIRAVERFDPAKGSKLSTYASWWIKQSIKRALTNQSKTIRLPVHLTDKIARMRRAALRLQEELGRGPTDEELGEELGLTARRVGRMRLAALQPASLDATIEDEGSKSLGDVVQDERATTPYEQLAEKTLTAMIRNMVKTLAPREMAILRARFGLDGGPEQTLEEIGRKCGITRERVRQLQNLALKQIRKMIQEVEATNTPCSPLECAA